MIYLIYRTDKWHSQSSRELVAICTSKRQRDRMISSMCHYRVCTKEQKEMLVRDGQSQCSGSEYEFEIIDCETNELLI